MSYHILRRLGIMLAGLCPVALVAVPLATPKVYAAPFCNVYTTKGQMIESLLQFNLGQITVRSDVCWASKDKGGVTAYDSVATTWSANGFNFKRWTSYAPNDFTSAKCLPMCKRNWYDGVFGGPKLEVKGIGFANEDNSDRGQRIYSRERGVPHVESYG